MCGIAGFTHFEKQFDRERIAESNDLIRHRGPDGSGSFQSEEISLGAVRLKVLDLESGHQPMISRGGSLVLVFNGEIFNYLELRKELQALGHTFHSQSDTEVLLAAFQEWDIGCLSRLRGMFAFAVWNHKTKRLILARDRMGIKPLYFSLVDNEIYFGSELKTLFAHPEISRNLDETALEYYLYLNYVPGPRTLVQGIQKLRAGHYLEWHRGRVRLEQYWRTCFRQERKLSEEEALENLDRLLEEAVRENLRSDVPVGLWLSGGLDSTTVLHYASSLTSKPIRSFSISFAGHSWDERGYIRAAAKQYGTDHQELDLNPELDLSDTIEKLAYFSDEPVGDAGALPVWYLSELTKRRVTVALSGEGADELFGGYLTFRADRLAATFRQLPRLLQRSLLFCSQYLPISDEKIGFDYKIRRFLRGAMLAPDESHAYWNGGFWTEEQSRLLRQKNGTRVSNLFGEDMPISRSGSTLNRYLAFDQRYYLPDDILHKVDHMSMAHALEVRPPFLDHRIVEFAASLPEDLKIRGNCQKYLLRRLMRDRLPPSVLHRGKMGLDIPTHAWFRGPLKGILLDTLSESAIQALGLFQPRALQEFIQDHMERRANYGFHLWGLLILFLWTKQWDIQCNQNPIQAVESRIPYLMPA